jgi:hypothetical protein
MFLLNVLYIICIWHRSSCGLTRFWPVRISAAWPIVLGQSMHIPGYYTYFTWHTPLLPSASYLIRCSLSNCPTWHRRSYWQRGSATRTQILTIQRKPSFGAIPYYPQNGPQSPCIVLIWNNTLWFSSLQSCSDTCGQYVKSTHMGCSLALSLTHSHTHTHTHVRACMVPLRVYYTWTLMWKKLIWNMCISRHDYEGMGSAE